MKLISVLSCSLLLVAITSTEGIIGGAREYTPTRQDPNVGDAMIGINAHYGPPNGPTRNLVPIVGFLNGTVRTVQGKLYTFYLEVSGSENGNEICKVILWSREWIEPKNLIKTAECVLK